MAELALQEVASYGFASLLPPLIAIGLAIYTRQVFLSLAAGIWLGHTILAGWNPAAGAASGIEGAIGVLGDAGNARVIVFTFLIGALIATVEANGGMRGFVRWVEEARWVTNGRRAQIMAWLIGIVVFIESNLTILVAGSVSRPLFDRFRVSREKLAYIIDSTSAPVCILIPFNAWGALVLGILAEQQVANPLGVFLVAIPLNLYAVAALALAGLTAIRGLDLGPMKKAEARDARGPFALGSRRRARRSRGDRTAARRGCGAQAAKYADPDRGHGGLDARVHVDHGWRHHCRGLRLDECAVGGARGVGAGLAVRAGAAVPRSGWIESRRSQGRGRPHRNGGRTLARTVAG